MASKLRRTPLFGYDGNLGIPIMPASSTATTKNNDGSSQDFGYKVRYKTFSLNCPIKFVLLNCEKCTHLMFDMWTL